MRILLAGGAGYIGSHTCVELLKEGHEVVIADNLSNSSKEVLSAIEKITGKRPVFYEYDLCDAAKVDQIFEREKIDGVIHFAALKAVGESIAQPLRYYDNNLKVMLHVLLSMERFGVKKFVFSSSATVYGQPERMPIPEDSPLRVTNPYGRTKLMGEEILMDLHQSDPSLAIGILRYFNPIGAHESGFIGENPKGIPSNLLPYISQVAAGKLEKLHVFGDDYPTADGSGVRDYIHVMDLAKGHLATLEKLSEKSGLYIYNLGTGKGASVFEMIDMFKRVSGKQIPFVVDARRPGDTATCYADPSLAKKELGFQTSRTLEDMCRDTWRWQCNQ